MAVPERMPIGMYSFDCADAARLAAFWASVLGSRVDEGATAAFATVDFEGGGVTWMFHRPEGDLPAGENRLMLDLGGGEQWAAQADRMEALGARRISDHEQDGLHWVVFHDPEGNRFRVFSPRVE
ncbi:VOC family protein [Streptomyces sp. NPDC046887]|uniref:VOC family protein n=1 Tax=Streptomyces sp. NPDC046887 TaxID=3155472 RepID=UPI0033F439C6